MADNQRPPIKPASEVGTPIMRRPDPPPASAADPDPPPATAPAPSPPASPSFFKGKYWQEDPAYRDTLTPAPTSGAPRKPLPKLDLHGTDGYSEGEELGQPLLTEGRQNGGPLTPLTPAEKVRGLLTLDRAKAQEADDKVLNIHGLFCQMDVLCHFDDGVMGWKEKARWLKYEEKVEAGNRWSKPHVATTQLHSAFEIRRSFAENNTVVCLDMQATHGCLRQVVEMIMEALREQKDLTELQTRSILEVLTKPHKHLHRSTLKQEAQEPAHDHNVEKRKTFKKRGDLGQINEYQYTYPRGTTPDTLEPHKPNKKMLKKIPSGSEVVNIMVGQVDFLTENMSVFVRLAQPAVLGDLTEVDLPTRFLYLVLGPPDTAQLWEYEEMGRAMASLMSDKVFCEVAYKATSTQDIVDGMDEYIDDLTVLPPSIWDPATRLEPPQATLSEDGVRKRLNDSRHAPDEIHLDAGHSADDSLKRTGRILGGLVQDMKRRYRQYWSDIKDGLNMQCLATIVFLYFACVTPIVTFGGLMGAATDGVMGTMESIMSGAICGIIFALFSGQPLIIVGATGPLLVFESILYAFCQDYGIDFLSFRFWIGTWVTGILILFVLFDLSSLVSYITRFSEESFSVLISLIFIMEAFKKLFGIWKTHPVHLGTNHEDDWHDCYCMMPPGVSPNDTLTRVMEDRLTASPLDMDINDTVLTVAPPVQYSSWFNWTNPHNLTEKCITWQQHVVVSSECIYESECMKHGWQVAGPACFEKEVTHAIPDVFLFSCILFLATFGIAIALRNFRTSPFFPAIVRNTVADFAVFTSIIICTAIDFKFGLDTPKLSVPQEFKNTIPGRGWFVNPMALLPSWYLMLLAAVPALLATILIFLDQQISAVIVNRKEHKLKKGHGYHLDLFVLCILIMITSFMGLPWFVAATVRSITHVKSLFQTSEVKVPGEKPHHIGVREQRVTPFIIHILIGLSVFLTFVLKHVPMPVLYGVFLFMGWTSLAGVQFVDRILLMLMPNKYQPDYIYVRHVQLKRIHIFTIVQIICMVIMWVLKSIKAISITFPLMVLALCFIRKGMDYFFTQSEMFWLDHILPDETIREKEDEGHRVITRPHTDGKQDMESGKEDKNKNFHLPGGRRLKSLDIIQRYRNRRAKSQEASESFQ